MAGFNDIIGNKTIKDHFMKAITNHKISHAYIINGERGIGKKTIARAFAQTVLCEEGGLIPCQKCHSCIQAMSDNNPDIIFVKHAKPNVVTVDEVREQLVNDIELKPYSYRYKVYIVEDADIMNIQAQNAILKTIEEPPEYVLILLLTNNIDSMLQTVRSRCVTLNMQPLRPEEIKNYLMNKDKIVDYQADIATSFSGGNLGKARELAISTEFMQMLEEVLQLLRYIKDMQAHEVVLAIKRAADYKFRYEDYIDLMILWFRDVLIYKVSMSVNDLIFKNEIKWIKEYAACSSYNGIEEILKAMEKAKLRIRSNVNFDITVELMFLTIRDNI